jgi:hypothetical protein
MRNPRSRLTEQDLIERLEKGKAKAKAQGLLFKEVGFQLKIRCEKHNFEDLMNAPANPKERKYYCLECAKEASVSGVSISKKSNPEKLRKIRKYFKELHEKGYGKISVLRRDIKTGLFLAKCQEHGSWWFSLKPKEGENSRSCKGCAKQGTKSAQVLEAGKRFFKSWKKRRNKNLVLVEEKYLGSYLKHRVKCLEHDLEFNYIPNGSRHLRQHICKECIKLYKYEKYGEGITSPAQIPGHADRLRATFKKNWGEDHYMKTSKGFSSHQTNRFKRKEFSHHKLGESTLNCQGAEPEVLRFLLDNDSDIVSISTDPEDSPRILYKDKNNNLHRYFPDAVVKRSDRTTRLVEVKVHYTLAGFPNILAMNLRKFKAASQFCRSTPRCSFHLFVVGKEIEHYKDPISSKAFKEKYINLKEVQT